VERGNRALEEISNDKIHDLRVIELRRLRWAGHVARMRERIGVYCVRWEDLKETTSKN
jgi:hypothetical protein